MSQDWFIVRGNTEDGPFTPHELKQMADSGEIDPTDLIRRSDLEQARPATKIRGLLEGTSNPALHRTVGTTNSEPESSRVDNKLTHNPFFIGLLLAVFYPVGLYLIWVNPRWSRNHKWKWTGTFASIVFGVMLFGGILMGVVNRHQRAELAVAHKLWDTGDKSAAIAKYRSLLKMPSALPKSDTPILYGRVIDFDAENGNASVAQSLLGDAEDRDIIPFITSPEARKIATAIATQRSQSQREVTVQATADSSGESTFKVSKGTFSGSIEVTLSPDVANEISISNLTFDGNVTITFILHWREGHGRSINPWHFTAYDKDGIKLDQSNVGIPDSISLGEKVRGRLVLNGRDIPAITRIQIHS